MDSSIPSISTNNDDREDKETNDIVQIGPGKFEVYIVYIDLREELGNKASGNNDWTMTSSGLEVELSVEDNKCKKIICKEVQDYSLEQNKPVSTRN